MHNSMLPLNKKNGVVLQKSFEQLYRFRVMIMVIKKTVTPQEFYLIIFVNILLLRILV